MNKLNERIAEAMRIRGIGTVKLAKLIGITPGSVSQWTSGQTTPGFERVRQIANVLDVREMWLYGEDVPMDRDKLPESELMKLLKNPSIIEIIRCCSKMNPSDIEVVRKLAEVIIEQGRES